MAFWFSRSPKEAKLGTVETRNTASELASCGLPAQPAVLYNPDPLGQELVPPGTIFRGLGSSHNHLPIQKKKKKNAVILPHRTITGGVFSGAFPSSQMTLACAKLA